MCICVGGEVVAFFGLFFFVGLVCVFFYGPWVWQINKMKTKWIYIKVLFCSSVLPEDDSAKIGYFLKSRPGQTDAPPHRIAGTLNTCYTTCMFIKLQCVKLHLLFVFSVRVCEMPEVFYVPVVALDYHRQTHTFIQWKVGQPIPKNYRDSVDFLLWRQQNVTIPFVIAAFDPVLWGAAIPTWYGPLVNSCATSSCRTSLLRSSFKDRALCR